MKVLVLVIILILVIVIALLIVYNIHIRKQIEAYNNINQKISNLSILQDFMSIAGQDDSVDEKLKKINDIVIL